MTLQETPPVRIVLEFVRAVDAGEPHTFRFEPQRYLLRTPGGGFESLELDWNAALIADLRALREPERDPEAVQRIGTLLRQFLAPAVWSAYEQRIVAAAQAEAAIHVTIRSAAAELYALPWELLALKSTGQLLGAMTGLLVRYEWPETTSFPESTPSSQRRGRVVLAWSASGGSVPAAEHVAALSRTRGKAFDAARDVLSHVSPGALAQSLDSAQHEGQPIDLLYILCHGAPLGGSYALTLDGATAADERVLVDAGGLQRLLAPVAGMLRVVVLAACDSGNAGAPGNHLASCAQMLHRAGIRVIVASRFPLSFSGSIQLCEALLANLSAGTSVERAFMAARERLMRDPGSLDWASIQLYGRETDGDAQHPWPASLSPVHGRGMRGRKLGVAAGLAGVLAGAAVIAQPGSTETTPPAPKAATPAAPLMAEIPVPVTDVAVDTTVICPDLPPGMACVPGGRVQLGSTDAEIEEAYAWCLAKESKKTDCERGYYAREVLHDEIIAPFMLAVHEVTNSEYAAWLAAGFADGSLKFSGSMVMHGRHPIARLGADLVREGGHVRVVLGRESHSVAYVTWYGAELYCQIQSGRLPSAAEWEYVARGAARRRYPWGGRRPESTDCAGVVFGGDSVCTEHKSGSAPRGQRPLDRVSEDPTVRPGPIFDLGGNLSEWVSTTFPGTDCAAPCHVWKGGNWRFDADFARSAGVSRRESAEASEVLGFRCARTLIDPRT